jgi:hypothetical protein
MENLEHMVRERLISEIEPEVRQQKATLLQSFAGAPDPSSSASEGASQLAEEHQQADDEA